MTDGSERFNMYACNDTGRSLHTIKAEWHRVQEQKGPSDEPLIASRESFMAGLI